MIVLYAVFLFYYISSPSFKTGPELFSIDYFPVRWHWDNYIAVFREQPFAHNIFNSVLVSLRGRPVAAPGVTAAFALRAGAVLRARAAAADRAGRIDVSAGRGAVRMFELIRDLRDQTICSAWSFPT